MTEFINNDPIDERSERSSEPISYHEGYDEQIEGYNAELAEAELVALAESGGVDFGEDTEYENRQTNNYFSYDFGEDTEYENRQTNNYYSYDVESEYHCYSDSENDVENEYHCYSDSDEDENNEGVVSDNEGR